MRDRSRARRRPIVALASFVVALVFFIVVKIGSLASFIATGIPLIYDGVKCLTRGNVLCGVLSLAIFAIVLAAHHQNLVRIFTGKERKTDLFKRKNPGRTQPNARPKKSWLPTSKFRARAKIRSGRAKNGRIGRIKQIKYI
ncbi:MAG: hypothetical protein ACLUSP_04500 [Christensenellales bacterium]